MSIPCFQDISIDTKIPLSVERKKEAKEKLNKAHAEDNRLVKGTFKNLEAPGGSLEFAFRKYPQDPARIYRFEDGKTYEIPICVAKHINKNCIIAGYSNIKNLDGDMVLHKDPKVSVQRYQFLSAEFM